MPLQDCDVLLHEAGAPPIHTPLKVLSELPELVKQRLYVVHTSALPEGSDLRVAPTGTAGTIRLDELHKYHADLELATNGVTKAPSGSPGDANSPDPFDDMIMPPPPMLDRKTSGMALIRKGMMLPSMNKEQPSPKANADVFSSGDNEYYPNPETANNLWDRGNKPKKPRFEAGKLPPLVFLRPTCVSDAWFILNLLSNVPFLSR